MARSRYERLSVQDASFLLFESPTAFTHTAGTAIYEAGPLRTADDGIDAGRIRSAVASLLHQLPRFRQRLEWIPLEGHPVWVDDPAFDLDFHFRHTRLPEPGGEQELKELSARIQANQMDRAKPLWETWVVEGLEGGRFAMIQKTHHCMIDGASGVDLMQLLLAPDPNAELPAPTPYVPRPAPTRGELLSDQLARRLRMPLDAIRRTRETYEDLRDLGEEIRLRGRAVLETLGALTRPAPETPLNGRIGPHRRVEWLDMSLDEVKAVRKALGGTVNDVVLATVAGAVRRFVEGRAVDPSALEFRVAAPVSTRSEAERGTLGNRVSMWILDLPIGEADPRRRLGQIAEQTRELKEKRQALGADVLFQVVEWTGTRLLSLAARRLAASKGPYNLMVTNVPGPQIPLYLCGAPLRSVYGFVPLIENTALGIALFSYCGRLCWAFNADYELMPDLADFAAAVAAAFRELEEAAGCDLGRGPELRG
jgi:WS/DGAT/MGAT family acyltransferase